MRYSIHVCYAPDASPEDKLANDIKKVIAEESAKIRTTSMTEAKLKAEQFHTEHTLTWMPPEELENEVISTLIKAFRYDAIAKGTEGMTSWDTDRYYTSETIGIMPSQKENIDHRGELCMHGTHTTTDACTVAAS